MLAVGDSTKLEIIFSTKKYKSRISKRPTIQTNEGPPDKHVQIIAHVVARPDSTYPVLIKPYKLDLTQFGDKVRDEMTFKITNVSDQELKTTMIQFPNDLFEVDLPKSIGIGESAEAKVKLTKEAVKSDFEKSFTIEFDDQMASRFTVPVKRTLRAARQQAASSAKP